MSESIKKTRDANNAIRKAKITILRVPMTSAFNEFKKDPSADNLDILLSAVDNFYEGVNDGLLSVPSSLETVAS